MFLKTLSFGLLLLAPLSAKDLYKTEIQPLMNQYCLECHGGKKVKGKIDLRQLQSLQDLKKDLNHLQALIDVIDYEEMPPEEEPQPNSQDRQKLLTQLKSILDTELNKNRVFAQSPVRRMTRFQYTHALEDLFQLKGVLFSLPEKIVREHKPYFDPQSGKMPDKVQVGSRPLGKSQLVESKFATVGPFPQDLRAEHGYDNRGDHLSLSPLLLESFLNLAQKIVNDRYFTKANVLIWDSFFAPPSKLSDQNQTLKATLQARLTPFLERAFRRPITPPTLDRYTQFALQRLQKGVDFTATMKEIAAAVISSPKFLYLYDQVSDQTNSIKISDHDLASRLSFFLWGSIPDQQLLDLAKAGQLKNPTTLAQEVERMLNDKKLKRFADSFPSQWLQIERIISSLPDKNKYPHFYKHRYRASMHMMIEPLLLFEKVLIENRSILDLIDPDFTYQSDFLALWKHRGQVPPHLKEKVHNKFSVKQITFEKRPIENRREGGIITNTAVMTMTSGHKESHPITRGAWVTGVIFNNPPEPPPADVPPLPEKPLEGEENMTLRERLDSHRERADCAGCHDKIDPLGFALENFNAVGLWRDTYDNGRKVDMEGQLFRKHKFTTIEEFKDAILIEKDRFLKGLAGHLLSFALARGLDANDEPSLAAITQNTIVKDYRLRDLIKEVILSESFLMKTTAKTMASHTQPNQHP